jgi:hypothetical protein
MKRTQRFSAAVLIGAGAALIVGSNFRALAEPAPPPTVGAAGDDLKGTVSDLMFTVNGVDVGPLMIGRVRSGDTVAMGFTISGGNRRVGLASYSAPDKDFAHNIPQQTLFASDNKVFAPGTYTRALTVSLPPCFFQVDAFTGMVLERLFLPGGTYGTQNRLLAAATGGKPCPVPVTTTTSPRSTSTTFATGSTPPPTVLGTTIVPGPGPAPAPTVLGEAVSPSETGTHPSTLANTGSQPELLLVVGVALLVTGLVLLVPRPT